MTTTTATLTTELCAVCLCHDVTTAPRLLLPHVGQEEVGVLTPLPAPIMLCDTCLGATS